MSPGSRCEKCKAPVFWRRSNTTGRLAPLDLTPVGDGNIVLKDDDLYVLLPKGADPGDRPTYKSHFATCPAAGSFRR